MAEPPPLPLKKPPGYRDPSAPVYPPPNPPLKRQRKKRKTLCKICCCCCCIFLVILLIIFLITFAVFYLWFNPKFPIFHIQSLRIDPFNISSESDGTYLSATTITRLEARNPNRILHIRYTDMSATFLIKNGDDEIDLGSGSVTGFVQLKKNVTSLKFVSNVKHVVIGDSMGVKMKGKWKNGDIGVNVEVKTGVGFGSSRWRVRPVGVRVVCENVTLKKVDDALPKCTINLFKWINIH